MVSEEAKGNQETKLRNLTEHFRETIGVCMNLTRQIDEKVTKIGFMPEPPNDNLVKEKEMVNPSENFVGAMVEELQKLEKNNGKMGEILNKLHELI